MTNGDPSMNNVWTGARCEQFGSTSYATIVPMPCVTSTIPSLWSRFLQRSDEAPAQFAADLEGRAIGAVVFLVEEEVVGLHRRLLDDQAPCRDSAKCRQAHSLLLLTDR